MGMFREKALVKLKSPEQLDEPLKAIRRLARGATRAVVGTIIAFLLWAIFGRLPENGRGQAILLVPNSVVPIQSEASGQVAAWHFQVGDRVEAGQVVGVLEQPLIEQQLSQARGKLEEVQERNEMLRQLRERSTALERASYQEQRQTLQKRIAELESFIKQTGELARGIHETNRAVIATEGKNLATFLQEAVAINEQQKARLDSYMRLREEQLASDDSVRNARRTYDDGRLKIRELELQREQLAFREVQLAETDLQTRNLLATRQDTLARLQMQLKELDNREVQLTKRDQETQLRDQNEIRQLERDIDRLERQLQTDRDIRSEFSGRILEITTAVGSVVNVGQRLMQLATREDTSELIALAYFPDKVGKSLYAGMPVRVAPTTVDNKQYGNIQGRIVAITEYPVTAEAVANYVGNSLVAHQLIAGGHQIEVTIELKKDPQNPSGYAWTSRRGADVPITAGTSADVWATYERRAPISFVLPKLRKWTGLSLSSKFRWASHD